MARPIAPRSTSPRRIPVAPCSRSCELVPDSSSSSRNKTRRSLPARWSASTISLIRVISAKNRDRPACSES